MIRLTASRLVLARAGRVVLDGLELAADGGEFIAVIGPNGSGKSTLLAALAGLLAPAGGVVCLDDRPLSGWAPRELASRRAYLPQAARCEWPLAVERVVALGLAPRLRGFGEPGVQEQARIEAVLADCDLLQRRATPVTNLSGGELARAMLARALVADPALLIVDEPLAGLDPRHAWDAARRLQGLAQAQGRLVIASVHDINIAMRCATRVWALHGGRLAADGRPEQVLTGALLGEIFDIPARVTGIGSQSRVDFALLEEP